MYNCPCCPRRGGGIIVIRAYIQYIYSIYRKNLDLTKMGTQIVSGVVQNVDRKPARGIGRCDKCL